MINRVLEHLSALLKRRPSRFPADESECGMTTEEHAVLMKALNPEWRVCVRTELGGDVGSTESPFPFFCSEQAAVP